MGNFAVLIHTFLSKNKVKTNISNLQVKLVCNA